MSDYLIVPLLECDNQLLKIEYNLSSGNLLSCSLSIPFNSIS